MQLIANASLLHIQHKVARVIDLAGKILIIITYCVYLLYHVYIMYIPTSSAHHDNAFFPLTNLF